VFGRLRPDRCFHLATRFQPRHDPADVVALVEGNVTLAALVGEGAASVEGCGVVYTGTYWQHFEGAPYAPTSLYAAMKQAGADVLRYYADCRRVPVVSLTLFNTYGPGEPANRITSLLVRSALGHQPVDLSPGFQLVDLLHVDDVVAALVATEARLAHDLAAHGPGWWEWTARSGQPVTLRTLAETVGRIAGAAPPVTFGALPYRPREMFEPWATAPDLPGWRPAIGLDEGLHTLAAALR
jgi:nucleoside-diphosphate-sugar epimerase